MKLLVALLVVFTLGLLVASSAHADDPGWMTCNKRLVSLSAYYYPDTHKWYESDLHYCLLNQTYSWEVQYTMNGTTWLDWVDDRVVTSGLCQNGCRHHGNDNGNSSCSRNVKQYRVQAWLANGVKVHSRGFSASYACQAGVL